MEYTLDDLVATVASRLSATGLDRQANGQVSAFPDRRSLRYYTTIGLMDRPDAIRDRQAIYSDRHVAQAVAVKRLQAAGLALAAIQAHMAGLPAAGADAVAAGRLDGGDGTLERRRGFWTRAGAEDTGGGARDFWGVHPEFREHPLPSAGTAEPGAGAARPIQAVPLAPGVELHLATDRALGAAEVAAIQGAAAPLVLHLAGLAAAGLSAAGLAAADPGDHLKRDCR